MSTRQYSTFYVSDRLYGIDVMMVQEITKSMSITRVPLAPSYVHGLINLRGQIATAVGLRELFNLKDEKKTSDPMTVVCKGDGMLLSLLVDQIGDVIEVDDKDFESTPETITNSVGRFMQGVYKIPGCLLSIIEIKKIIEVLNK
jgi:purine-binding chemotaxis protein CheW